MQVMIPESSCWTKQSGELEIEDIIGEEIVSEGVSRILGTPFELGDQDQTGGGVINRIQAAAKMKGIDLGNGWKARAALELAGTWAENKTTLPDELLDIAEQLFLAILVGHGGRQPQLDHLPGQQTQGPVVMPFRRRAAGQSNQVGFAPVVQLPGPVGLGTVLQNPLQPFFGKALLDPVYGAQGHIQSFGHLGCRPTVVAL